MFKSAQNWEFDVILVWKIDRLFRKTLYLLDWIEALEKLWIWFISITQPFDTTQAFWKMMLQMLWVIAELERELIKERTQSWIMASMKKWKLWRWMPVYWYSKDKDGYLIIDIEESKIVKLVYSLLIKDWLSIEWITKKLNNMWIETSWNKWKMWNVRKNNIKHSNFWHRSVIYKMLTNEIYIWKLIQNRFTKDKVTNKRIERPENEWIITKCPKIIQKKTFLQVQTQLEKNTKFCKRNKQDNSIYMLWSLMTDKETWYAYTWYKATKWTKQYRILIWKAKSKVKVKQKWVSWNIIETLVWNKVKNVLLEPKLLEIELEKLSSLNNNHTISKQINLIGTKIKKLELNSKNIMNFNDWLSPSDIEILKSNITDNREQINIYLNEIKQLESKMISEIEKKQQLKDLKKLSTKISDYIKSENIAYDVKTDICRQLINNIVIDNNDVEITLSVPDTRKRSIWNYKDKVLENMFDTTNTFITDTINKVQKNTKKLFSDVKLCSFFGGFTGLRSQDLSLKRRVLYQLSYESKFVDSSLFIKNKKSNWFS